MNHFLLTGNELVADWPKPEFKRMDMQRKYRGDLERYANRPRYTCTKELLAMLKEGERYEINKDFETHPCSCDRRMDNHTDCGKPGKNRTAQCFIAVPVYTGEAVEKGEEVVYWLSQSPAKPEGEGKGIREELETLFTKWAKETKRGGGVLIGSSIHEFIEYASNEISPASNQASIEKLYELMGEWSKKTFPDADSARHLIKLQHEAKEAAEDQTDILEYADCFLCLIAAAYKQGFTLDQLTKAAFDKFDIVQTRQWDKQADGTYQHRAAAHSPASEEPVCTCKEFTKQRALCPVCDKEEYEKLRQCTNQDKGAKGIKP